MRMFRLLLLVGCVALSLNCFAEKVMVYNTSDTETFTFTYQLCTFNSQGFSDIKCGSPRIKNINKKDHIFILNEKLEPIADYRYGIRILTAEAKDLDGKIIARGSYEQPGSWIGSLCPLGISAKDANLVHKLKFERVGEFVFCESSGQTKE